MEYDGLSYEELDKLVKQNLKFATSDGGYYSTAIYCNNYEELKLALAWENEGSKSFYDEKDKYIDNGFFGSDWYFFERDETYCDGHCTLYDYYYETLSMKKEKFKKYCDKFENLLK